MYSCALSKPLTIIYYDHGIANISYKVSVFFRFLPSRSWFVHLTRLKLWKKKKRNNRRHEITLESINESAMKRIFFGLNRIRRDWMKRDRATHHDDKWFYVRWIHANETEPAHVHNQIFSKRSSQKWKANEKRKKTHTQNLLTKLTRFVFDVRVQFLGPVAMCGDTRDKHNQPAKYITFTCCCSPFRK